MVLLISLTIESLLLLAFTLTDNYHLNLFIRFVTGISQVFISIYTPVWADTFGSEKLKSLWITSLLVCSPLGIFLGFTLTSVMNIQLSWEWSFYIQSVCVIPCLLGLARTDNKYLDIDQANEVRQKCSDRIRSKYEDKDKEEVPKSDERKNDAFMHRNPDLQEFLESKSQISLSHPVSNRGESKNRQSLLSGLHSARGFRMARSQLSKS